MATDMTVGLVHVENVYTIVNTGGCKIWRRVLTQE